MTLLTCTEEEAEQQLGDELGFPTVPYPILPDWSKFGNWWLWLRSKVRLVEPAPDPDPYEIGIDIINAMLPILYGPAYPTFPLPSPTPPTPADPEAELPSSSDPVAIVEIESWEQLAAILLEAAEEAGYDLWATE
ncbi:hypothetical protein [Armatimonas rosea]|uniref:Uncharacterized protein n=1 Tax=Armatimonas rosea TaxID=685828 RepID=A0A7W9W889_ARMRO|nr:hypothetical protein [Armatimonas rosea]MBB6053269.1 hypothetical protein [Armatimonas rosea]